MSICQHTAQMKNCFIIKANPNKLTIVNAKDTTIFINLTIDKERKEISWHEKIKRNWERTIKFEITWESLMKQDYLCLRTNEFQRCISCFSSLVTSTKSSSICNIIYSVILVFEFLRVVVIKLEQGVSNPNQLATGRENQNFICCDHGLQTQDVRLLYFSTPSQMWPNRAKHVIILHGVEQVWPNWMLHIDELSNIIPCWSGGSNPKPISYE